MINEEKSGKLQDTMQKISRTDSNGGLVCIIIVKHWGISGKFPL